MFNLKPTDLVEDRRIKNVFPKVGDTERYSGIFGEVIKVTKTGFRVQWFDDYEMGYSWGVFGNDAIAKVEARRRASSSVG